MKRSNYTHPTQDFELKYNVFPICPRCGHEHEDWWDGSTLEKDG